MSRSLGNILGDSLQQSLSNAERLVKNIPGDQFARLAAPGGRVIESNHAAFVFGHLALYPQQIVEHLGGDPAGIALPPRFQEAFSKDATCQDDPDGTIYPPMDEVTDAFFAGYRRALECLRGASDEVLALSNPRGGTFAERFPTLGSMTNFYVGGHMMLHLGQLSAWRRMIGLGPA